MIIPIVGPSALEFWLSGVARFDAAHLSAPNRKLISLPDDYETSCQHDNLCNLAEKYGLSLPLHIMVNKPDNRRHTRYCHTYLRPKKLSEDSFVQLSDSVYISSPELCFLQVTQIFPLSKLVEIANDLCALYLLDKTAVMGQTSRDPLVQVNNIKEYLCRVKSLPGVKLARQAISYALDCSGSPMESKLSAVAMPPLSQGGYALLRPELNLDISLTDEAASFLGRDTCCCDLVWEDQKVVVEYDSNLTHLSQNQHAYDKRKATALSMSGYRGFYITASNLRSFQDIEITFRNLRKILGQRADNDVFKKYESRRREAVRKVMYESWEDYLK
ncbi:MAG: hypothetical protein J5483_06490 [Lachnospiraceae bacterium]|nr:hypothetical protein [Lachnospiraceae bacterium]